MIDLRLHRDVERRDRLVGDDERRIQRERAGQADALALSAAELVRIPRELRPVEPDQLEQLRDARTSLRLAPDAVDDQRLFDDVADPHPRIERRVRILKDDLHVAARLAHARPGERQDVLALEPDFPDVGSISRRMQRPVVVLPLPDSPTSPNVSPCSIVKLTPSTARTIEAARRAALAAELLDQVPDLEQRHQLLRPGRTSGSTAGPCR